MCVYVFLLFENMSKLLTNCLCIFLSFRLIKTFVYKTREVFFEFSFDKNCKQK